jgi:hypothetical protein
VAFLAVVVAWNIFLSNALIKAVYLASCVLYVSITERELSGSIRQITNLADSVAILGVQTSSSSHYGTGKAIEEDQ